MKCNEIRELLSLYIDNMLDESGRKTVEDHLSTCDVCRNEYNEIKETINLLGQVEMIPVPDTFRFSLKQALQEEKQNMAGRSIAGMIPKKKSRWRVITSVAAVFVVGVLSFGFYHDILGSLPSQLSGGEQTGDAKAKDSYSAMREENASTQENTSIADTDQSENDTAVLEDQSPGLQPVAKAQERADDNSPQDVSVNAQKKEAAFSSDAAADANTDAGDTADNSQMNTFGAAASPDPNIGAGAAALDGQTGAAAGVDSAAGSDQNAAQNSKIVPPSKEYSRSLAAAGVERNTAVVQYYDKLIQEKLNGFDYQLLGYSYAQTGEWQFRVFIFRGKDGNTYNEEILIIGKEGKITTVSSNKFTELFNYEDDNH